MVSEIGGDNPELCWFTLSIQCISKAVKKFKNLCKGLKYLSEYILTGY